MPPAPDIFAAVADASARLKLPILVVGGHAVNAYGYVRTTLDADFLIAAGDLAEWRQALEGLGYAWRGQTGAFVTMTPPQTVPPSLPVDIMLVSRETFGKLRHEQRELPFGPTRLPVPQPLHLIALKLHAMRNDERRRLGKDLTDVVQLIRRCGIDPAAPAFQQIVDRYANAPTKALLKTTLDLDR